MISQTRDILLPLLEYLKDGEVHTLTSTCLYLRKKLNLSEHEISQVWTTRKSKYNVFLLSSTKFYIRVADAVHVFRKAKILQDFPGTKKQGVFFIANEGLNMLKENQNERKNKILKLYEKYSKKK